MFFRRKDIDPWEWTFVPNLFGLPEKFKLETGVIYRLKGLLSPGSGVRIVDEHGNFVFAAEAQSERPWMLNQPFCMEKEMGDWVTVQFCGEAEGLRFEIDGVNCDQFR